MSPAISNQLLSDLNCLSNGSKSRFYLHNRIKGNLNLVQRLKISKHLKVHNGCVNTICWNDTGQTILSGSDDQHLVVTDPFSAKVLLSFRSGHRANIFSAKFLPESSDRQIVSCSGDGMIFHTDVTSSQQHVSSGFDCHQGAVYEILTVPMEPCSFLSCGEDGTVRWFDLRTKQRCHKEHCKEDVIINNRRAVMSMSINPVIPFQLAVGCSDNYVRLYDRRMLVTTMSGDSSSSPNASRGLLSQFTAPTVADRCHRITSVAYSSDGSDILASYSADHLYLFNLKENCTKSLNVDSSANSVGVGKRSMTCSDTTLVKKSENADSCPLNAELKRQSTDGADAVMCSLENSPSSSSSSQPSDFLPIRRLRLRGDWSDTGPDARPESERTQTADPGAVNVMQRMSEMLTRWLEGTMRQSSADTEPPNAATEATSGAADTSAGLEQVGTSTDVDVSSELPPSVGTKHGVSDSSVCRENNAVGDDQPTAVVAAAAEAEVAVVVEDTRLSERHTRETCTTASRIDQCSVTIAGRGAVSSESVDVGSKSCAAYDPSESAVRPATVDNRRPEDQATAAERCDDRVTSEASAVERSGSDDVVKDVTSAAEAVGNSTAFAAAAADEAVEGCAGGPDSCAMQSDVCNTRGRQHSTPTVDSSAGQQTVGVSCEDSKCSASQLGRQPAAAAAAAGSREVIAVAQRCSASVELSSAPATTAAASGSRSQSSAAGTNSSQRSRFRVLSSYDADAPAEVEDDDDDVNRQMAAIQLQEMFRKRQAEKCNERCSFQPALKKVYSGHRNARTMIKKATFWGENHVMSGSDCGHIFIWDRQTARVVMLLQGDKHVVNCLQPHPHHPVLASSGIDYDVKLWMPINEESCFDQVFADELIERNRVMLNETRDTLTVPATFMIRMLASMSRVRRDRMRQSARPDAEAE